MADESESFRHPWALGTAVVGFAMVAIYVALILGDGASSFLDALPWATLMALPAAAALAAAYVKDRRIARNMLVAAAVVFLGLGLISILSIGLGFLFAGGLATIAAVRIAGETVPANG
jgi:hypothetical protein